MTLSDTMSAKIYLEMPEEDHKPTQHLSPLLDPLPALYVPTGATTCSLHPPGPTAYPYPSVPLLVPFKLRLGNYAPVFREGIQLTLSRRE